MNFFLQLFTFFIFFMSVSVKAGELYQPGLPSRCLAMGGVCISQVRGAQGLYLNPATLAKVQGFDFIVAQAQVGVSKDAYDFSSQFQGSTFQASDFNKLYGKILTADVDARSGFVMPNLGFGVFSNNYTNMQFNDPTYPTFDMKFISDYGYILGGALGLGDSVSIGASVRHIKRWGGDAQIAIGTLAGQSVQDVANANFQNHGVGHALDVGLTAELPGTMKPVFAAVWRDAGKTTFNVTSGPADPPRQEENLILGLSLQQELGFIKFSHGIEYKFATEYSEDATKKLHLGTEAAIGPLDLRAGVSQGYLTYGVGLDFWFFTLDAAGYATEMGTYAGQARSDRYSVNLTFEMDFDQSFKLIGSNGKKRRLLQRR